jgi:hypothetical protein
MWPTAKPAVVSVLDSLTSNLARLGVFCFSTESFHFDCKVKLVAHDGILRALANQSEYDGWETSLCGNPDARMILVTDGAWFRFESRKLGQVIFTFFERSQLG